MKKILTIILSLCLLFASATAAMASEAELAVIDTDKTASVDIYKYDFTRARSDGVWNDSYVSTGAADEEGVESILGDSSQVNELGNGGVQYGYAIRGVEFSYLKIAEIRTYTENENGVDHVEVLYGIARDDTGFLTAVGLDAGDRYAPADENGFYYYQSDVLVGALSSALASNETAVKNDLEDYIEEKNGTPMALTDSYGHTGADSLSLGLYLIVETSVPEMVTSTTAPFLVSLPMTTVDGSNAVNGGEKWIYEVTLYPKNETGFPTLEKTVRESKADTGKNLGSSDSITDGYSHNATASGADRVQYQILSTLPTITSEASYLSGYTFSDSLEEGLRYSKNDLVIGIYKDKACTDPVTVWKLTDAVPKFRVVYNTSNGMSVSMTEAGLAEINESNAVYSDSLFSGYSDCTMRLTYEAVLNSNESVDCGDDGMTSEVTLTWQRTTDSYLDLLEDDCHVYTYGIDLSKQFSDGKKDFGDVEMILHNDTDGYYLKAEKIDGIYYMSGRSDTEAGATHFIPNEKGKILVKGLEEDSYTITEIQTASGYTLLKDSIRITIANTETDENCDVYEDTLGIVQNDERYTSSQTHLEHKLLTASASVDGNAVNMETDSDSANALVPLTVVNTKGFTLPKTGSQGNWMFPAVGCAFMALALVVFLIIRKKDHES